MSQGIPSETSLKTRSFSAKKPEDDSDVVRWYVLTLPAGHRGAVKGLMLEQERRKRNNQLPLEIFSPTYEEVKQKNGEWVKTNRPLLYNYVFIRASVNELYRMKRDNLTLFNFLPRMKDGKGNSYPYITDKAMTNLKWIADSYSNVLPIYYPEASRIMRGDRIRIIEGQFKGVEAIVAIQPGQGKKNILVSIENWAYVPLIHVQAGEYEVIELNDEKKHLYGRLDNNNLSTGLHQALGRYHTGKLSKEDKELARQTLREYGNPEMRDKIRREAKKDIACCKLYALILPAHTILGDKESCRAIIGEILDMLKTMTATQSCALLYVTLYGCTDNHQFYQEARNLVDKWRTEQNPKKNKQLLLQRFDDYNAWLSHK